ncbi:LacI family transcriptional regulator [Eubacteriales bacterium OttesenSCG-928-A19]|nr:LacI family transcriptional regulator [Eubacteriales bacterium OttesenSCG-928-A19]
MKPGMSITAKEIAKICNVSRGTVDRALNGRPGISEKTRARIQRVAEQYNYTPHLIASTLSKGQSMSIGVVLFDLKNRYFSQISNAISLAAREAGYFTYIAVSEKSIDAEMQIIKNLAARSVDGLIMLPIAQGDAYTRQLQDFDIPIVTIGNHLPGIHRVSVNDFDAAYDSTHHIAQAGYRRICFICPPLRKKGSCEGKMNITSQDLRAQGFQHYMDMNANLSAETLIQKDFCERAAEMVRAGGEKIAFFCSSDVYALDLLKHFREQGISVPGDAGLMGFDNLDILDYIEPRVTTVSGSVELQGRLAFETLLRLIAGQNAPETLYVAHSICTGATL